MAESFKGTINVDVRDSVADWAPFEPPKAPGRRDAPQAPITGKGKGWASF